MRPNYLLALSITAGLTFLPVALCKSVAVMALMGLLRGSKLFFRSGISRVLQKPAPLQLESAVVRRTRKFEVLSSNCSLKSAAATWKNQQMQILYVVQQRFFHLGGVMLGRKLKNFGKSRKFGVSKSFVFQDGKIHILDIECMIRKDAKPEDHVVKVIGDVDPCTMASVRRASEYCEKYLSMKGNDILVKSRVELQFSQPVKEEWHGVAIFVSIMSAALKVPIPNAILLGDVDEKGNIIIQDFGSIEHILEHHGSSISGTVVPSMKLMSKLRSNLAIRSKVEFQGVANLPQLFNKYF